MQQNRSYAGVILSFFLFFVLSGVFLDKTNVFAQNTSGVVIEAMNSAGYTYLLIDSGVEKTWVAIPESTVVKGEKVTYKPGMVMKDFSSNTLGRTFESIIFSPGLTAEKSTPFHGKTADDSFAAAVKSESSQAAVPAPVMEPSGGSLGAVTPFKEITVAKSSAANGYSVEEIFSQAKKINGQKVSLRGIVTKVSPNIMGRNWIHLQDGTGNPMQNTHDIVATSSELPEINSEITIEGVVAAEKDFGAGYKYAAIIEQATVIK